MRSRKLALLASISRPALAWALLTAPPPIWSAPTNSVTNN
jgi:hypothetical protein